MHRLGNIYDESQMVPDWIKASYHVLDIKSDEMLKTSTIIIIAFYRTSNIQHPLIIIIIENICNELKNFMSHVVKIELPSEWKSEHGEEEKELVH